MTQRTEPGPPHSPSRTLITAVAIAGLTAYLLATGNWPMAIAMIGTVAGIFAIGLASRASRRRRGVPDRTVEQSNRPQPGTPRQQLVVRLMWLLGMAGVGALAIIDAKPGERVFASIVVGIALVVIALLAIPTS